MLGDAVTKVGEKYLHANVNQDSQDCLFGRQLKTLENQLYIQHQLYNTQFCVVPQGAQMTQCSQGC